MSPAPRVPRRKTGRKSAVAVRYERESMGAPQIVAKGRGIVAEKLIALARESGVPIVENKLLVEMLEGLNLNQEIPGELYQVVAEILVTIYKAEAGAKKSG